MDTHAFRFILHSPARSQQHAALAMLRNFALLAFLALLLAARPAAVAQEVSARLDVPVFVGGFGIGFFEQTARLYEAARPGAGVDLYGDPRIADKLGVRLLEGDTPDLTDANLPWSRLIASEAVLDLTPFLDGPDWHGRGRWRDTFVPGSLDRWTVSGKVYGIPFAHAVWAFFYDKAQFRRQGWTPPRTWDEFFALCERQRAAGLAPVAFPGLAMRYADPVWRHAYHSLAGPEAFRRFNQLDPEVWRDPAMVRSLGIAARLARDGFAPGWEGTSHTGAQLALLEGRAAMTLSASWIVNEMRGRMPPGFELGAFNFPEFAASDMRAPSGMLQTGSGYYFVFAKGPRSREAVDFLRFLTTPERAAEFSRLTDAPTAIVGAAASLSPVMADTAAMMAVSPGSFDYPPQTVGPQAALAPALAAARQSLLLGKTSAEETAATLHAAAMAERRRLEDPTSVAVRHGGRAALLLAACALLALYALRGRNRRGDSARDLADASTVPGARRAFPLFVAPAFLLYAAFSLGPSIAALGWSVLRWDGVGRPSYAAADNFSWLLLESDTFWTALGNNLFLMIVPAALVLPVSLALAAALHRKVAGAGLFRAVVLFPNILGGVAGALIWLNAYEPAGGFVNASLVQLGAAVGALGLTDLGAWLGSFAGHAWLAPDRLYWALVPIYLWLSTGFNVVLYLAAMQGVDADLHDAASIDGAGPWRRFLHVTLPSIRGTVVVTLVFVVIGGLNTFEMVWLLTGQDPPAGTHTLGTWMIHTLFREFQVGRAAALGVMMGALVLVLAAAVRTAGGKEESG